MVKKLERNHQIKRRIGTGIACAMMLGVYAQPTSAQISWATNLTLAILGQSETDSFIQQQRTVEERLRQEFDKALGDHAKTLFDWGGWYSSYLFVFDDGFESSRTLRRHDLRLWGRWSLDKGAHEFYARGRWSFLDFNHGDSFDGDEDDFEGPSLERGFYRFDLNRWRIAQGKRPRERNLVVGGGRDLVYFGSGLSLALPLDHVSFKASNNTFELSGFWGNTVGSLPDVDLTRTATRTHRNLYGMQLKYKGLERHEPYIYAFRQEDKNREVVFQPLQRFDYDSFYIGIGSSGELAKNLHYSTEWVYETGESYGHRQFLADNKIRAWAAHAGLQYLIPGPHRARVSAEYLFGSGDAERFGSPTNSVGGNLGDREDTSFVGFGYKNTGLALAPTISNLHMGRLGYSFYPLPDVSRFRQLELGTNWYLYYKHHRVGAISDPSATRRSSYLGWEMDYFANWRMSADLAWTVRMGAFFPGDAYRDTSVRTFFLMGITWSF